MAHALNLVLRIKQDPVTQALLTRIIRDFSEQLQPLIEKTFRDSGVIHFARVFVIESQYMILCAEYDGPRQEYTEFFRRALSPVFRTLLSLVDGAPDVADSNGFWEFTNMSNLRSLGNSINGDGDFDGQSMGYLFSAYAGLTVQDILSKLD